MSGDRWPIDLVMLLGNAARDDHCSQQCAFLWVLGRIEVLIGDLIKPRSSPRSQRIVVKFVQVRWRLDPTAQQMRDDPRPRASTHPCN